MVVIKITITIIIMNVEYIWLTSLNAKQVSSAVCGPAQAPPRRFRPLSCPAP